MSWWEAIVDSLKFILAELFAPVFDWLVKEFIDGIFWMGLFLCIGLVVAVIIRIVGINPANLI